MSTRQNSGLDWVFGGHSEIANMRKKRNKIKTIWDEINWFLKKRRVSL